MARLFGAYVVVDWSAREGRKVGEPAVRLGVAKRDVRFRLTYEASEAATRAEGERALRAALADLRRRGDRALIGFDVALGFPRGTAAALKLPRGQPWAASWDFLRKNVVDKADGTNNRFAVAAKMNRLMTDEARPFWGAPGKAAQRWLSATKPATRGEGVPPEFRHTDAARGRGAKSVWQMHGAATVGGQALVGIPAAKRLLDELGDKAAVWPFTTGWRALKPDDVAAFEALICEVFPPLHSAAAEPGETAEQTRIRATCEALARLDDAGKLGTAFGPAKGVDEGVIAEVEHEEGWILGA